MLLLSAGTMMLWVINPLGLLPNLGVSIGYYGDANRLHAVVEQVEGVTILRYRHHEDVTLEGTFFDLSVEGREVFLNVFWSGSHGDPVDAYTVALPGLLRAATDSEVVEAHLRTGG